MQHSNRAELMVLDNNLINDQFSQKIKSQDMFSKTVKSVS